MKVTLMACSGLLAMASICACNNNDTNNTKIVNGTDSTFVLMAGMSNTAELGAAQLALTKSTDTAVLNYANMMIADHTVAQASLKNIGAKYGLTAPDSLDALHVQKKMELDMLTGRTFDSAYIYGQVVDHQTAVQLYQTEGRAGNNTDLTNFADTTLPKLQMHLEHANMVAAKY